MLRLIKLVALGMFFLMSCNNATDKIPIVDSGIIELWDNGQPRVVWVYGLSNGEKVAIREIQYFASGAKSMEGSLLDEKRHGEWKSWYEDGNLWSEGSFREGRRHGKGIVYHSNGNKFIEGTYLNGQRVGTWLWYDKEGNVISEAEGLSLAPDIHQ
jgi:antitoxin component YwqK of YwqJK toxin-antitoxin module